jgi:hypothetical protein
MALFQKDQPGSTAGGHVWTEPGEIIEILDERLAADLRKMSRTGIGGIREVFHRAEQAISEVVAAPASETDVKAAAKTSRTAAKS